MRTVKSKLNTAFIAAIIATGFAEFAKDYRKNDSQADKDEIESAWEDECADKDYDDYFSYEPTCCAVGELTQLDSLTDESLVTFLQYQIVRQKQYSMLVWYGPNSVKEHKHTADVLKKCGFQSFAHCSRTTGKGQIEALYFVIK